MTSATIEYAHTYLKELVAGAEPPDLTPVVDAIEEYDEVTTLVIVDDTNADPGIPRDGTFEAERDRLAQEWVAQLDIEPDVLLYESDFTDTIDWFTYQVPLVTQRDLTPELDIGAFYSDRSEGLYFYTGQAGGTTRARVTDQREGAKVTNYSCGAYDAAMTLAKLGAAPTPDSRIVSDKAISFHDPDYIGSPPFSVSEGIRSMLNDADIVQYNPTNVQNHALTPTVEAKRGDD